MLIGTDFEKSQPPGSNVFPSNRHVSDRAAIFLQQPGIFHRLEVRQVAQGVVAGERAAKVALAFGVSLRTVRKWLARFRAGGGAALCNRASAPTRVAGRLPDRLVALALHLLHSLRLTGAEIARKLGLARSIVARWLVRAGMGWLATLDPPEPVRRYQRARPGEPIHLDIRKLGRFERPGHRVIGTRTGCRNRGAG